MSRSSNTGRKKTGNHRTVLHAVNSDRLANFILNEILPVDTTSPKSTSNFSHFSDDAFGSYLAAIIFLDLWSPWTSR